MPAARRRRAAAAAAVAAVVVVGAISLAADGLARLSCGAAFGLGVIATQELRRAAVPRGAPPVRKAGASTASKVTYSITSASSARALMGVLQQEMRGPAFGVIQISAAFSMLAKLRGTIDADVRKSEAFAAMSPKLLALLEAGEFRAREVVNVFWSIVKMKQEAPEFLHLLPQVVSNVAVHVPEFRAPDVSQAIWACATHGLDGLSAGPLLRLLADKATERAACLEPQHVANIAWAAGKLKAELLDAMPAIASAAAAAAGNMKPQELANFAWAAATLKEEASCLQGALPAIAQAMSDAAPRMTAQDLACAMWAAAELRRDAPELGALMPTLAQRAVGRAQEFAPSAIAMVIWSAGRLGLERRLADELFRALCSPVANNVQSLSPQTFAMVCSGLARCGCRSRALWRPLASGVTGALPTWGARDLAYNSAMVAWSFAKVRLRHATMFSALAEASERALGRMADWDVCALAWSYREVQVGDEWAPFLARVDAEIARRGLPEQQVVMAREGPPEADWATT